MKTINLSCSEIRYPAACRGEFHLTLVERKCGHLLMHPLSSKKADEVTTAIIVEFWPFVGKIRSLTMENGKEFSGHETFSAILQTKVYFAHPYASWERGTNENTNGLIRQYLPKGMSFRNLDMALCKEIERKLNIRFPNCELAPKIWTGCLA